MSVCGVCGAWPKGRKTAHGKSCRTVNIFAGLPGDMPRGVECLKPDDIMPVQHDAHNQQLETQQLSAAGVKTQTEKAASTTTAAGYRCRPALVPVVGPAQHGHPASSKPPFPPGSQQKAVHAPGA